MSASAAGGEVLSPPIGLPTTMIRLALILWTALCAPFATAQSDSEEGLGQLRAFLAGAEALRARFEQLSYDVNGRLSEQAKGELLLARPNRLRVHYREPFEQLIIADGRKVWVYDPELEQVTVRRQPEADPDSPLLALIAPERIEEVFRVEGRAGPPGSHWLRLIPRRPREGLEYADLLLIDGLLKAMQLHDGIGQRSEYSFAEWQRDPPFSEAEFLFVVPPGVEVVRADE